MVNALQHPGYPIPRSEGDPKDPNNPQSYPIPRSEGNPTDPNNPQSYPIAKRSE
ncbi:31346_t:CDS:1, partial [Gigaspora margarita]